MRPIVPEEEKEVLLPKSCYFNDGKRKVDYVIVYPQLEERLREDRTSIKIEKFITEIVNKGLLVEKDLGQHHTKLFFVKIHAPHKVLVHYANVFNITLTCQNPYYKYKEKHLFNCLRTELTRPNPKSEVYRRAEKTLSGVRPTHITTAERSQIVFQILKRIIFLVDDDEFTLRVLLDKDIFLDAYAIHDGDCAWSEDGPLTDRQLLFHYWANVRYIFREQPVHLIEKYYGPKVAFYFGLVSLYTKMLIVPTVIGTATILAGFILLYTEGEYLNEEVCKSDMILCSDQKLKTACGLIKVAYIIDNPVTIFYVISCSFWGVVFWSLWQRRQAMLRLRWNLTGVKIDRTMRREFQENANTRRSSITGEMEYYVPPLKKFLSSLFSYFVVTVMLVVFFLIVLLTVEYRFFLRRKINYDNASHANEIELYTSSLLTAILIMLINSFLPLILKLYSKIIHFLTLLRIPRTQAQYNRIYLHMTFIISFINHFSSLFYLAYIKGLFDKDPGRVSQYAIINTLYKDICKPSGCLVDLGVQLIAILIVKTITKCVVNLIHYVATPWHKFAIPKDVAGVCGQWEKDFALKQMDQSVINELYVDLVLQYSFIAFFNGSLPVIGLIALIHNLLKIQHDAFRFLKLYRRPILEKVPDIEGWNDILKVVTVFGIISNAYVVAFRTDFIYRSLYERKNNGSMKGYINSTLSAFAINDFQDKTIILDHGNETHCFYRGFRHPHGHRDKYEVTDEFWRHLALQATYFIALENFTLVCSLILGYLIPEMPRKMKEKLEYDEKILKAAREAQMEKERR